MFHGPCYVSNVTCFYMSNVADFQKTGFFDNTV